MSIVLSTASVPAGERLDYWYEVISQTYGQLRSARLDLSTPTKAPYQATLTASPLGSALVSTTEAAPLRIRQTAPGAAGADTDYVSVSLQVRGEMVIDRNGGRTVFRPGTLAFFDTTCPFATEVTASFRSHVFQIPRWMVGFSEADLRLLSAAPIEADTETAALVISFLSRLADRAADHPPHVGDLLARNAADLITTLAAERLERDVPDTGTDAAGTALLLRVKAFIERNLADPDLSPQTIAAAHHMSLRHLHRLFEKQGTTVSRWIRHNRLEACRRELGRPGRNAPTVTSVAHRFGFTSPTHFSRTFRAAYGMSPREWRSTRELRGVRQESRHR
ncbi:helix-turn-helix domain-containing protein [Streptomyces sp. NPDC006132]|uniref:helix-turn-helix domain-containing protein n=1 Tax=Streptomyces sp. NPDC006132 TaxID=3156732 RepID=UPI0033CF0289